jgi:thiamine pyrophosphate-dependent acetolactate synthase large subunit-like protein
MSDNTKALTVHDATHNLLRKLGLTTIFGNPGSTKAHLHRPLQRRVRDSQRVCGT